MQPARSGLLVFYTVSPKENECELVLNLNDLKVNLPVNKLKQFKSDYDSTLEKQSQALKLNQSSVR